MLELLVSGPETVPFYCLFQSQVQSGPFGSFWSVCLFSPWLSVLPSAPLLNTATIGPAALGPFVCWGSRLMLFCSLARSLALSHIFQLSAPILTMCRGSGLWKLCLSLRLSRWLSGWVGMLAAPPPPHSHGILDLKVLSLWNGLLVMGRVGHIGCGNIGRRLQFIL